MRSRPVLVRLVLAFVLALPGVAAAATIIVPDDQPTIQAAVAAAQSGDTIRVKAGIYTENVAIDGITGLTLAGERGTVLRSAGGVSTLDVANSTDVEIRGLTLDGDTMNALHLVDSVRVEVTQCEAIGPGRFGVYVERCEDTAVERCSVASSGLYGILVDDSPRTSIVRCEVESSVDAGILTDSSFTLIDRCTVRDAGGHGIAVAADPTLEGIRIVRCDVDTTGTLGIVVTGQGTLVDRCVVVDAGAESIVLEQQARGCVIRRCRTVRGKGGYHLKGTQGTLERSTAVAPSGFGIGVVSTTGVVRKNKVSKPGEAGIHVFLFASSNVIERNGVTKSGQYGVVLEGFGNTLTRNKSKKSAVAGLDDRTDGGNTLDKNNLD